MRGPHKRVAEPVSTASVERWRERLSPAQVALVEQATAPLLERFGYRPADALEAGPAPDDARELARQRRLAKREWWTSQRGELLRRAVYRSRPWIRSVLRAEARYGRGTEQAGGTHYYLDMTVLGRQEDWEEPKGRSTSRLT